MAVNIHITIIELNALHTKRQNLFQELDAVIHLLMEAKHWGLRKSRNATSLNSRFKSLDTQIGGAVQQECRDRCRMASAAGKEQNGGGVHLVSVLARLRTRSPLFPYTTLFRSIHITIIELNALHTKRQNLFQELDAVIHLLMEAKHWGLRKSRNATSLNSRFKSLDTLKVKIISVTFRRVIRTNHKKASKI